MGPVHARDDGPGVSGTEPECSARYWDLLYTQIGVGIVEPIEIGLGLVQTRQEK